MDDLIREILTSHVYDVAIQSPLDGAHHLSASTENQVYLKREDLQSVFSFKLRGAYNRIARLSPEEKKRGVIAASAGNHAQGVALSAKRLGIDATIVMPATTPAIKIDAVRKLGGTTVLYGESYSDAAEKCQQIIQKKGSVFIHPFDDPLVIAGQGTVGHEILQQLPDVDAIFVPVGGGGLISGIAAFLKAIRPEVQIIGVEPEDSNAMQRSIQANERIIMDHVGIFADGVAVKQVGIHTFSLVQKYVDDIVTVSTDELCSAIKLIYTDTRSIVEPAGALGVAGLIRYTAENKVKNKNLVAINSGANMNFQRLQFVTERTRTGERKEALFAVTIPEKPGALREFCNDIIGGKNITEFNYRMTDRNALAHLFVGIGIENQSERMEFKKTLESLGYTGEDMTDNELAKTHVRHMVGGKSAGSRNEVLYRFQFPEKPGALSNFLNSMSAGWNISLFHYRMHGGDFGRVLVGMEIPPEEISDFQDFLKRLNYTYFEETENPVFQLFL